MIYNINMNFALILKFLIENFAREKIDFALMGGFALQSVGVTRTTQDIDVLVLSESSSKIKEIMLKHRYELLYESEEVLNFTSKDFELGKVDFLLAHRKYTLAMLKRAKEETVFNGKFKVKVLCAEDQIGLKVQASSNNPKRLHKDMSDIRMIMENNYPTLDLKLVREYFSLFNREKELDVMIKDIGNA